MIMFVLGRKFEFGQFEAAAAAGSRGTKKAELSKHSASNKYDGRLQAKILHLSKYDLAGSIGEKWRKDLDDVAFLEPAKRRKQELAALANRVEVGGGGESEVESEVAAAGL
ncbi:hypothetical protein F442_18258 [Phytophthora nicotianae P10297]|uniref:Uncharacterized protein n=3 Tax=Phytophthora nicotianae TaxID=4792 RepID=V9EA91_PHYNI|nr:hypothetical protein F443_18430 [Phytophthora nicotianae P1569]ETM35324.1 hypothetical protein L914_17742 [Phytophthora nicotianae]ETP33159.1 hypothetical protein F442_18258 [Phytophthora nicotianae P10297]